MANNKLADLNNHLFAQLERLGDEDIKADQLAEEINRAKAITGVAKQIIDNAKVTFDALKFSIQEVSSNYELPDQFKLKQRND